MSQRNIIRGEIYITDNSVNQDVCIINSHENFMKEFGSEKLINDVDPHNNEKEIKESVEIKIDDKPINFTYTYKFETKGMHTIEYSFKKNLTKICNLFAGCNLGKLDLSNFNTENVTDMREMFMTCVYLQSLNLSNINTQNVTDMYGMFNGCISLKNLNLSNFKTKNVTDMSYMFFNCEALTNLDLSNFETQNTTIMDNMFDRCKSLEKDKIITENDIILNVFKHHN